MQTPENVYSFKERYPDEKCGDNKGTIMVYGSKLGWRTVSFRATDHFVKYFECSHWSFTPDPPRNQNE